MAQDFGLHDAATLVVKPTSVGVSLWLPLGPVPLGTHVRPALKGKDLRQWDSAHSATKRRTAQRSLHRATSVGWPGEETLSSTWQVLQALAQIMALFSSANP